MQPYEDIENSYLTPDPWGYKTNPEDIRRKGYIIHWLNYFISEDNEFFFKRALDIGAGEGWLTEDIPAVELHGFEISNHAAARFPKNVTRVNPPHGKYDLVVATGIFYDHYNWPFFMKMIKEHAHGIVLTCNIKSWEHVCVRNIGKQLLEMEFPYREYTQKLRIFEVENDLTS